MADMLGDRVLPNSIVSQRRQLRDRVQSIRQPIRQFRQENIPGPNVVDTVESQVLDLRDQFVRRDSVLSRISERRSGNGGSDSADEPSRQGRNKAESMV